MGKFKYLPYSLVVILAYVGVKMVLETLLPMVSKTEVHFPPLVSLGVIVASLVVGITVSILRQDDEVSPELAAAVKTLEDAAHPKGDGEAGPAGTRDASGQDAEA